MAESMPGTMSIFGNAYQAMLASQGRGGGLTGQAAVAALLEAVPTGNVRSADLLPFVAEEMRRRAAPKLEVASGTSLAWQGRLGSMRTDWAAIASEAGLETGQMRMFRWMTQWMNENRDIAEKFGKFWDDLTQNLTLIMDFPAALKHFLEGGENSVIGLWFDPDERLLLQEAFRELTAQVTSVTDKLREIINLPSVPERIRSITEQLGSGLGLYETSRRFVAGEASFGDVFSAGKDYGSHLVDNVPFYGTSQRIRQKAWDTVSDTASGLYDRTSSFWMGGVEDLRYAGRQDQNARNISIEVGDVTVNTGSGDPEEIGQAVRDEFYRLLPEEIMSDN